MAGDNLSVSVRLVGLLLHDRHALRVDVLRLALLVVLDFEEGLGYALT